MTTRPFINAYIQGDWVASPVSGSPDESIAKLYEDFLEGAASVGVVNKATWHKQAIGVVDDTVEKNRRTDVMRNMREIDRSDVVITYLQRNDPPKKHWGSLFLIGYAVGKGKPVILLAPHKCIVWKHHGVHHPLVERLPYTNHEQAVSFLCDRLSGELPPAENAAKR